MWIVGVFLVAIIVLFVVVDNYNNKRHEEKGICQTTGGTCTSKIGCTCGDEVESH